MKSFYVTAQMKANKKNIWTERMRNDFYPIIRLRGEDYAASGKVQLRSASYTRIEATVHGTLPYQASVYFSGSDKKVSAFCTCPFFEQGHLCKHIWASLIKADEALRTSGNQMDQREMKGKKGEGSWKTLFSRDAWGPEWEKPPWASGSSSFLLFYELTILPSGIKVSAMERFLRKDGKLGRLRSIRPETIEHRGLPTEDKNILSILDDQSRRSEFSLHMRSASKAFQDIKIENRMLDVLVPLLAMTGRCDVTHYKHGTIASPLMKGKPFEARLKLKISEKRGGKDHVFIEPMILASDPVIERPVSDISHFFNTYPVIIILDERLYSLNGPGYSWMKQVMAQDGLAIKRDELPQFFTMAESLVNRPDMEIPDHLGPKELNCPPQPRLVLKTEGDEMAGKVYMRYDKISVDPFDPKITVTDARSWVRVKRDLQAEQGHLDLLKRKDFRERDGIFYHHVSSAAKAVKELLERGWIVEEKSGRPVRGGTVSRLKVSSGMDWFDLDGKVSFGPVTLPLAKIVWAYLKGETVIPLEDGSMGILPVEWLEKRLPLLEPSAPKKRKDANRPMRFPVSRAPALDLILEDGNRIETDQIFQELREAISNFSGIKPLDTPKTFKGKLRPYQKEALGWFSFLRRFGFGGVLADDMGLGKTVQVLAMLAGEKEQNAGPSLVVTHTSLVFNWKDEASKFTPSLSVLLYAGNNRQQMLREIDRHDLVIATYGVIRRDIETIKDVKFHYVILDESQAVKNPNSQIARAVRQLRAQHRLCLTGTPIENNLVELWSQMEFLNPGLLGSKNYFETHLAKPITRDDESAKETLKSITGPFLLRRTKDGVAGELPEKVEHVIRCPMTQEQENVYNRLRLHYLTSILEEVDEKGVSKSRFRILEGILRLRQAANHPALVLEETDAGSGKLNELSSRIEEVIAGNHKALIFSQFTSMLRLIKGLVEEKEIQYVYLDGSTPGAQRAKCVKRFQENEETKLFLISLKAGGLGLNLTAADYVFLVDPWWNPAVEQQAIDRTHRIGQTKNIFTYHLISAGTIEEKILSLQKRKKQLAKDILSSREDILKTLSKDDIRFLFS